MTDLILFGASFGRASMAVRKARTYDTGSAAELLERAAAELPGVELLVLSTCNRTEFYLAADDTGPWRELLERVRPAAPATSGSCEFYERRGADAFRHLARVACGLESAILGDTEVLSQLRAAVALAERHGTLGPELSDASGAAIRLGRAARAGTSIAAGSAGIGSAVAATIPSAVKRVAVIGAGEAAHSVARHLVKRGIVDLTFCNRTSEGASRLADEYGGVARPWAALETVLKSVDAAAVTTAAPEPILDAATLAWISEWRRAAGMGPLTVIDAGFPPQVTQHPVPGVRLVPLDALRRGGTEALAARRDAVPAVEAMIEDAVAQWLQQRAGLRLSAAIRRLHEQADAMTRELAGELVACGVTAGAAERIVRRPMRRLLHELVGELRSLDAGAA